MFDIEIKYLFQMEKSQNDRLNLFGWVLAFRFKVSGFSKRQLNLKSTFFFSVSFYVAL